MSPAATIDAERLLEVAPESILVTTPDLDLPGPVIIYVNPAFEKMTGWAREEILGKTPRVMQGPKTDRTIFRDLKTRLRRGETWEGRTVNYRKDGAEFIMEWSIAPVCDDSGGTNLLVAESTAGELKGSFDFRLVDSVKIRGRSEPVTLYTIDR